MGVKPLEALKKLHLTVQEEAKKYLCGPFLYCLEYNYKKLSDTIDSLI